VAEPHLIPLSRLSEGPYSSVLCFPKPNPTEIISRIQELQELGITALEFSGKVSLFGVALPVLGKGFVGIVVSARMAEEMVAVKIRRLDADRPNLLHEAQMLRLANGVKVGPKLIEASKNFLVMEIVNGDILPIWLQTNSDMVVVKAVVRDILEQCWRLDQAGLDHGELSKAPKHVLVDKAGKAFIVDFETASVERRDANVTAICQYLFASNSSACVTLTQIFGLKDRTQLVEALRSYKKNKSRMDFENLIRVCIA